MGDFNARSFGWVSITNKLTIFINNPFMYFMSGSDKTSVTRVFRTSNFHRLLLSGLNNGEDGFNLIADSSPCLVGLTGLVAHLC